MKKKYTLITDSRYGGDTLELSSESFNSLDEAKKRLNELADGDAENARELGWTIERSETSYESYEEGYECQSHFTLKIEGNSIPEPETPFDIARAALSDAINTLYDSVKAIVKEHGGFIDTQNPGGKLDNIYGYTYDDDVLYEKYVYAIRVTDDDELEVLMVPITTSYYFTLSKDDIEKMEDQWESLRCSFCLMTPTLQSISEAILEYID